MHAINTSIITASGVNYQEVMQIPVFLSDHSAVQSAVQFAVQSAVHSANPSAVQSANPSAVQSANPSADQSDVQSTVLSAV